MKTLLLLACVVALPLFGAETLRPLEDRAAWKFTDAAAWSWGKEGDSAVLSLKKASAYVPPFRSPFNLAWLTTADWKSFTLTVDGRLTKFDAGNNDLCIAFGRQADDKFYYAHLGETADAVHHQIHIVNHADRKPITVTRTGGNAWKEGTWHKLKVVHNAATGEMAVYFDDMMKPALTAKDTTFDHGWIGLGSFDDLGEFKNLEIQGERK
jgi:hypothetical protein